MADALFEHPRLAAIYDALDGDREDLAAYVAMADEFGACRVLDIGCGTGTLALLLAEKGVEVTGIDPAAASLQVARAKPGGERVTWLLGDATDLRGVRADLATMTGNVAQAIVDPLGWRNTLRCIHSALVSGGRLAFESRGPGRRAWEQWNRAATYRTSNIAGAGIVDSWVEVTDVSGSLVSFRWTWTFASDGVTLTSDSTLRFRERDELVSDLLASGFAVADVRDATDRPGQELVFIASRS